jgi:polyisoprenoid-binding protein YceI
METADLTLSHFAIDTRSSKFVVQAFATGLLSRMGHNPVIGIRNFSGDVKFSPETERGGEFRLVIQMASLAVQDDIGEKDRREIESMMKTQVLEVAGYPEAVYEAPAIAIKKLGDQLYSVTLEGRLQFHGVTRGQPVIARVALFGDMLRASGDFILRQSDYQVKPVSVAGGALKLKDELKFSFEMVARKQD